MILVTNKHISNHIVKYNQYFTFFTKLYSTMFSKISFMSFEYLITALESLHCLKPTLSRLLIGIFFRMDLKHINKLH